MPGFGTPSATPGWGETLWNTIKRVPQALGPASAEAVVLPQDEPSRDLVRTIATGATMPPGKETNPLVTGHFDPLKREIYQHVLRAAEARPEAIPVSLTREGLAPNELATYSLAPEPGGTIRMAPRTLQTERGVYPLTPPTAISQQDTLSHELLHFLMGQQYREMSASPPRPPDLGFWRNLVQPKPGERDVQYAFHTGAQHPVIRYLLGSDQGPPSLEGYNAQVPFTERPEMSPWNEAKRKLLYNTFFKQLFPEGPLRERALLR